MADIEISIVDEQPINVELLAAGPAGVGVPEGGTAGQVLAKTSNTDYATGWVDPSGGAVDSVNGQTGEVELEAPDIPFDSTYLNSITGNFFVGVDDTDEALNKFGDSFVYLSQAIVPPTPPELLIRTINKSGHGLSVLDIVRLQGGSESGSGTYVKSDATSLANSQVDGIVVQVIDANNFVLALTGYIPTGFSGLNPPNVYYLSETPGQMTTTPPSTPGSIVKPIFKATGSTRGILLPNSPAYVVGEYVEANSPIVGATKTKITYDAKGLVTAGADATTADIADSSNKRYVTDANLTVIGNTSGTNTGDQPLASLSEVNSGTDATKIVTSDTLSGSYAGSKVVAIQVFDATAALATGDGKAYFRIPTILNGMDLVSVGASVITTSSSGTPTVQVARGRQANATTAHAYVDMLSTALTIDALEYDSKDATTAAAINTSNDDVLTGDLIRIDCDVAGTGTQGLNITLTFRLP